MRLKLADALAQMHLFLGVQLQTGQNAVSSGWLPSEEGDDRVRTNPYSGGFSLVGSVYQFIEILG
jgi:hypothetical protein